MKICILSDSHDNIPLLRAAVIEAGQHGAEAVLHCGDIVAPSTLGVLQACKIPVYAIHGNNTGDLYMLSRMSHKSGSVIQYYGQDAEITLAGCRIFLVHYPHYARAMAVTGDYDLVCCGHTHKTRIEQVNTIKGGETLVVNPGTVGGVGGVDPTYVLGDLSTMTFTVQSVTAAALSSAA